MVKAKLSYNPYLLETEIRFDNQSPKINSSVEKYEREKLQKWLNLIPKIFYDEMNGYDFDLEFSGTKLDFFELKETFQRCGINEERVRIFLKNELESVGKKRKDINHLLQWLSEHLNENFDYDRFKEQNRELFEESLTCIILNGENEAVSTDLELSITYLEDIDELLSANLKFVPILIGVDKEFNYLCGSIQRLLQHPDFQQNQLFFLTNTTQDHSELKRVIGDLGIESPCMVNSVDDIKVKRYLDTYSETEFVYQSIKVFRKAYTEIANLLTTENARLQSSNEGLKNQIANYEGNITRLKEAVENLSQRNDCYDSISFKILETEFYSAIIEWSSKKITLNDEAKARVEVNAFETDVIRFFNEFLEKASEALLSTVWDRYSTYTVIYHGVGLPMETPSNLIFKMPPIAYKLPPFADILFGIYEEKHVVPKDILGSIFGNKSNDSTETVRQVTYHYRDWRKKVVEIVTPKINEIMKDYNELYVNHSKFVAATYLEYLDEKIKEQTQFKGESIALLSDDEVKLQKNYEWLAEFEERLVNIERG